MGSRTGAKAKQKLHYQTFLETTKHSSNQNCFQQNMRSSCVTNHNNSFLFDCETLPCLQQHTRSNAAFAISSTHKNPEKTLAAVFVVQMTVGTNPLPCSSSFRRSLQLTATRPVLHSLCRLLVTPFHPLRCLSLHVRTSRSEFVSPT